MKGTLNVWDILFKQTNPTLTMQVSSFTSRSVASPAGQVVMPIIVRPPLPINLMPYTFYCFSGHYIENDFPEQKKIAMIHTLFISCM